MPRPEHEVNQRNQHHRHEDRARPIETSRVYWGSLGPEAPEEGPESVDDGHGVDGDAPSAEGELGRREGLWVIDTTPKDAADRDRV